MGKGRGGSSGNVEITKIVVLYIYCYTHRSPIDAIIRLLHIKIIYVCEHWMAMIAIT